MQGVVELEPPATTDGEGEASKPAPPPRRYYKGKAPYVFLLPYVLLTSVFFVYPFLRAVALAFYQTNGPRSQVFVGLDNFLFLFQDVRFQSAIANTILYTSCSLFLQLPLALALAVLLNSGTSKLELRLKGLFRLILFSPNLVGPVFVGVLFGVMMTPRYGLVNRTLHALVGWGLERRWVEDPKMVMPALVLISLWLYVGFNMVYFLAALQGVDKELEQAARIDGAGRWQVFWNVTLPSIRHVVVFVVILSTIGSFNLFELPMALLSTTNGAGPDDAGLTVITYLNEVAYRSGDLGLGSAVGWIVALMIMTFSFTQYRLSRASENE
ncbi:MAG: L-arabinose transport system permease protein AraP [Pseudomonadota bacterium]|jgi:ABC-type sugar transport system permease subunit